MMKALRLLALSLSVTVAALGIKGPQGERGPAGPEGCIGKPKPRINRPYLKQKKGRANVHHPANRPKGYTR